MSKEGVHETLTTVLLILQLCLGLWQILKLTPVGAMVKGVMGWSLRPLGLSPTYTKLKHLQGRVLKEAKCVGLATATDQPIVSMGTSAGETSKTRSAETSELESSYLNVPFRLERLENNMVFVDGKMVKPETTGMEENLEKILLFVDGKMCYYITDKNWVSLVEMANIAPTTAFVKGYKKIWLGMAAGGVMSLSEVMDHLILDNQVMMYLNQSGLPERLLPVDLSVSEEKLLKVLNLIGLFLQTKSVYWMIPIFFSLTSALLEFLTPLRVWLYGKINLLFCNTTHLICDRLPWSRRKVLYYSLGYWVENLKPSNDIQLKKVRGDIEAIIAGGAKCNIAGADLAFYPRNTGVVRREYKNGRMKIECKFEEVRSKCRIWSTAVGELEVDCSRDEFMKLCAFLSCIVSQKSGSLKSGSHGRRVIVRGVWESIVCYMKSGYPKVYVLRLNDALVC